MEGAAVQNYASGAESAHLVRLGRERLRFSSARDRNDRCTRTRKCLNAILIKSHRRGGAGTPDRRRSKADVPCQRPRLTWIYGAEASSDRFLLAVVDRTSSSCASDPVGIVIPIAGATVRLGYGFGTLTAACTICVNRALAIFSLSACAVFECSIRSKGVLFRRKVGLASH